MSRAQEILAERSKPGWRPTETELGHLQTHDMPTIPVSEPPLDAIADFCRKWGIKTYGKEAPKPHFSASDGVKS